MYRLQRFELVENLRLKGILDESLLQAMSKVEREKFVSPVMKPNAYKDIALPIGYGQTISQPYTIAIMTEALQVIKDDKVLEIGTGSGYQAAVLLPWELKFTALKDMLMFIMKF